MAVPPDQANKEAALASAELDSGSSAVGRFSGFLSHPVVVASLWVASLITTAVPVAIRYRAAVGSHWYDFMSYFLPAAQRVADGGSPYEIPGYVHSPVVASVTLLCNWPTMLVLWLGQTDLMVLGALSLAAWGATRERAAATGLGLSAGALIKTWPAVVWVWLLRRRAPERGRSPVGRGRRPCRRHCYRCRLLPRPAPCLVLVSHVQKPPT